jgi:hypothetical protein
MKNYSELLKEKFGEPIGMMAGQPMVGVRDERTDVCPHCGELPIDGICGCGDQCPQCAEMPVDNSCGCGLREAEKTCDECGMKEEVCECSMSEAKKKKGPTKKTAQKILRGTKTFKDKMKKVSNWAEDPAAAAAWMMHKATGKWPSEK